MNVDTRYMGWHFYQITLTKRVYLFVPLSEKFEIYAISMLLANQRAKVYCNTDNYKKPLNEISSKCIWHISVRPLHGGYLALRNNADGKMTSQKSRNENLL